MKDFLKRTIPFGKELVEKTLRPYTRAPRAPGYIRHCIVPCACGKIETATSGVVQSVSTVEIEALETWTYQVAYIKI